MTGSDSKACSKCGAVKPLEEFYVQKGCRDGRRPDCKACRRATSEAHRKTLPADYDARRYAKSAKRREAQKASARRSYAANREAKKAYQRAYHKANPEVGSRAWRKRRALLMNVESEPYTRREIYDRDNGMCQGCGKKLPFTGPPSVGGFHIDHIVPVTRGGPDTRANVRVLCHRCNREKQARTDWVPPRPALF